MISCRFIFAILIVAVCSTAGDLDSLFVRIKNFYAVDHSQEEALTLANNMHPDGTWDGPIYFKKWHTPIEHLKKIRILAEEYEYSCGGESSDECAVIKSAATVALLFWFDNNKKFVSDNWWMNEIGVQREFAPIAFLMWDELSDVLKRLLVAQFPETPDRNGVNRTWISELVVMRGILERRVDLIKNGLDNIEFSILRTGREGHQYDHSYFMHGNLLYNGGYGKMALSIATKWAAICLGTSFAFDRKTIDDISALALEGNRWMMWKGMVDPMVLGREISRKDENKNALGHLSIVDNLIKIDSSHVKEYIQWRKEILGDDLLKGCHYFERGELLVCRSSDYYVSLKMSSRNTVGSESINRENRKGFWLGAGVLSVYRHPDDFKDIYPLWDWSMLPGVTSYNKSEQVEKRVTNQSGVVGGLVDGTLGVATMVLDRSDLFAKKTWIFLDDIIVALGSNISSKNALPIRTTLDQRLYVDSLKKVPVDRFDSTLAVSCLHDGILYRSLDGQGFRTQIDERVGNWNEIGTFKYTEAGKILSLWVEHGSRPLDAGYAYTIEIGKKQNDFSSEQHRISVIQNDSIGQIVHDRKNHVVGGTLFRAASFKIDQQTVYFDAPCVFLFKEDQGSMKHLSKKNLLF